MKTKAHVSISSICILIASFLTCQCLPASAQSNLVVNGSFEQLLDGWSPGEGCILFTNGGAQAGNNYVMVSSSLTQEVSCEPGKDYFLKFSIRRSLTKVYWGSQEIALTNVLGPTNGPWLNFYGYVHADNTSTQLRFEKQGITDLSLDDIVLADANEPVQILAHPQSRTLYTNYNASFTVLAQGAPPFRYKWYCNDSPVPNATNYYLYVSSRYSAPGAYYVVVSNSLSTVTSSVATLTILNLPEVPQITAQPLSGNVPVGANFNFHISAMGVYPLYYQWKFDNQPLPNQTNSILSLYNIQSTNAGYYSVTISNQNGFVSSLPASLTVVGNDEITTPNGWIGLISSNSLVYDSDGMTRLAGTNYVLGTFLGTNELYLNCIGWNPLGTGFGAGVGGNWIAPLNGIPPYATVFVQMRCWDSRLGNYEAARAQGSKYGFSPLYTVLTGTPAHPGPIPMTSFAVHESDSDFWTGRLEPGTNGVGGLIVWRLTGETGFRYLIESQTPPADWTPYIVLTNNVGSVSFITTNQHENPVTLYRSRILE